MKNLIIFAVFTLVLMFIGCSVSDRESALYFVAHLDENKENVYFLVENNAADKGVAVLLVNLSGEPYIQCWLDKPEDTVFRPLDPGSQMPNSSFISDVRGNKAKFKLQYTDEIQKGIRCESPAQTNSIERTAL
jgi:hypothetical protein